MIDETFAPLSDAEREAIAEVETEREVNEAFDGNEDALEGETAEPAKSVTERPRTKRRIVPKIEIRHLAQEMLMDGIATVLGYWHEDLGNLQKLEELGITQEQLGEVMLKQADGVAKKLGFEQAWSN